MPRFITTFLLLILSSFSRYTQACLADFPLTDKKRFSKIRFHIRRTSPAQELSIEELSKYLQQVAATDLENLRELRVQTKSIICDGYKATLKIIRGVYPQVVIQKCVDHAHATTPA